MTFIFLFYFFNPSLASAETTLFVDDFSADASKWDVIGDPGWNVVSGEYGISMASGLSNSVPKDDDWDDDWKNIVYEVDLRGVSGIDKNILVKFMNPTNFIEVHHTTGGKLVLAKTGVGQLDSTIYPLNNGVLYHFRIVIDGASIKVYINGSVSPILEAMETGVGFPNWKIGLRAGTGGVKNTEVWFDNVRVTAIGPDVKGPFELPFAYNGRNTDDEDKFKTAFNDRFTSLFDHDFAKESFVNYMGDTYDTDECDTNKEACYDSHNGVDFKSLPDNIVLSVAEGEVVYKSADNNGRGNNKCIPKGAYGCTVVVDYTGEESGIYGMYAHLKEIVIAIDEKLTDVDEIGRMGRTGRTTGKHLHFSAMRKSPVFGILKFQKMKNSDWDNLVSQVATRNSLGILWGHKSRCTYTAPNGLKFEMIDPNGWSGDVDDPWAALPENGGCGIESPYLWKF